MASGSFYGFTFGMGGIDVAVLGKLADINGVEYVYQIYNYLPLPGLLSVFLPISEERLPVHKIA